MIGDVIAYLIGGVIVIWWLVYWPYPTWPGRNRKD